MNGLWADQKPAHPIPKRTQVKGCRAELAALLGGPALTTRRAAAAAARAAARSVVERARRSEVEAFICDDDSEVASLYEEMGCERAADYASVGSVREAAVPLTEALDAIGASDGENWLIY